MEPTRWRFICVPNPAVKDAQVWQNSYGPGLTIQTDNYTVYTTLLEPLMLRQVPAFLESAYKAYQSQLPRTLNKTQPLEVYLFGTRAQWEQFTQDTAGADARGLSEDPARRLHAQWNCGRIQYRAQANLLGHRPRRDGINSISGCLCIACRVGWMKALRHCLRPAVIHRGNFCSSRDDNLMRLGSLKTNGRKQANDPAAPLDRSQSRGRFSATTATMIRSGRLLCTELCTRKIFARIPLRYPSSQVSFIIAGRCRWVMAVAVRTCLIGVRPKPFANREMEYTGLTHIVYALY